MTWLRTSLSKTISSPNARLMRNVSNSSLADGRPRCVRDGEFTDGGQMGIMGKALDEVVIARDIRSASVDPSPSRQ